MRSLVAAAIGGALGVTACGLSAVAADRASGGSYQLQTVAGRAPVATGTAALGDAIMPTDATTDRSGDLYIIDDDGYRSDVEKIDAAGKLTVVVGYHDHANVSGTRLSAPPRSIATDRTGDLYVVTGPARPSANFPSRIQKITPSGALSDVVGGVSPNSFITPPGSTESLNVLPRDIATDTAGNLYISDVNGYVEKLTPKGNLSIVSGIDNALQPGPIAADRMGNVYVADGKHIDKISPTGVFSVFAGDGESYPDDTPVPGPAIDSPISPGAMATDSAGDLYVGDGATGHVEEITPSGTLSVIAGDGLQGATVPGQATETSVTPTAVAVGVDDSVYIGTDQYIIKLGNGRTLSIIAGNDDVVVPTPGPARASAVMPNGVAADAHGNLYIADGKNGYVERVSPTGVLSIVAGNGTLGDVPVPGPATSSPLQPGAIAVDSTGDLYIADAQNDVVKVSPAGSLSVFAGDGDLGSAVAGPATATALEPEDLAIDSKDNVYISDGNDIDKVTPDGSLTVLTASGSASYITQPGSTESRHIDPDAIAVDPAGDVYILDGSGYLEKLTPGGVLSILAGNGSGGDPTPGPAALSSVGGVSVAVDGGGDLYIGDVRGFIEKITPAGVLSVIAGNGDTSDAPVQGPATSSPISPESVAVGAAGRVFVGMQTTGGRQPVGYVAELIPTVSAITTAHVPSEETYGRKVSIPVTVTSLNAPSGTVTATSSGAGTLGSARLGAARKTSTGYQAQATITVSGTRMLPGRHAVILAYSSTAIGVSDGAGYSANIAIAKSTTAIRQTVRRKRISHKKHAKVTVAVTATGVVPTGDVGLYERHHRVALVTRTLGHDGRVTVKLPLLKTGMHHLVARFSGSSTLDSSESVVLTLRSV